MRRLGLLTSLVLWVACSSGSSSDDAGSSPAEDAGATTTDAGGVDSGAVADDAGTVDAGHDAGTVDAGHDAGHDASTVDAGELDAGADAGVDAGPECFDDDDDGHSTCDGDCDDGNDLIFPTATETCTGAADDDCNGRVDCEDDACALDADCAACVDADGDGWFALGSCSGAADCSDSTGSCGADCFPGNEPDECDGKGDNDCDGVTDEDPPTWYYDQDGDGYGVASPTLAQCNEPDGYTADLGDCAPTDGQHWADCGACVDVDGDERGTDCDLGEDCDESAPDLYAATLLYEDLDRDGIGSGVSEVLCLGVTRPVGHTPHTGDCDDTEVLRFAGALEVPGDGIDNDCDLAPDPPIGDASAVYVSAMDGDDGNAGTAAAPLATLAAALTAARADGKAIVLDEGTYVSGVTTLVLDVPLLGGFAYDGAMAWPRDVGTYVSEITSSAFTVATMEAGALSGVTLTGTSATTTSIVESEGTLLVVDSTLGGAHTQTIYSTNVLETGSVVTGTSLRSTVLVRSKILPRKSGYTNGDTRGVYVRRGHLAVIDSDIESGECYTPALCARTSQGIEAYPGSGTSTLYVRDSDVRSGDLQYSFGVRAGSNTAVELDGAKISTPSGATTIVQQSTALLSGARYLSVRDSVLDPGNASAEAVGLYAQRATVVNSYVYGGEADVGIAMRSAVSVQVAHSWFVGGAGAEGVAVDADGALLLANSVVVGVDSTGPNTGLRVSPDATDVTLTNVDFFAGPNCPIEAGDCYDTVPEIEACTFTGCASASGISIGNPNAVLDPSGARILQAGSICIDAGSDVSASFPDDDLTQDFLGAVRPNGGAPDLGPTEYVP